MSVTAGGETSWLPSFAICGPNGHSLKSRLSTLDRIVDDDEVICRDLIKHHAIDPLKRILRALTAAQKQTRADNTVVPESLKALLRDLAAEACGLVVFLERFGLEKHVIQLLRNDSLVKRMHQTHVRIEMTLSGVQQLRSEGKLPACFASDGLRPHDNDERLQIRFWRDLVNANCANAIDNILQRTDEPPSVAIRCAVQHEWRRQNRLNVLMPVLRQHEGAVRQYLTAGNTRELERQLMQLFVPSFELVIESYAVEDGEITRDLPIGSGGYGKVYRGEYNRTSVVAKRLIAKYFDQDLLLNELLIWRGLRHSNVLRFMGVTSLDEKCWIVSEDARYGNLKSHLTNNKDQRLHLLHGAALGLAYLHAQGIVHADLRCENILVGRDGQARVADFGLSFRVTEGDNVKRTEASHWRAPECIANQPRSFPTDVYMFGMTIVEACFGGPPYANSDDSAIKKHVTTNKMLPPSLETLSDNVQTLVRAMCAFEPADRITMAEVVARLGVLTNEDFKCAT